ncbi:MAG: Undecaprenyl-phosphate 4-deoxy-4-formamido-L-arabinose transferase [Gammaproteobacteria bacterium]|nr:MAG: Undecaprenyl-phosphate 4-deoxy-4-formamido-L-arabinose transferase [Gammaproteobacteria bacterium]
MKPSITLFIPIKNEIDGLREIMPRIKREWVEEIFILDAGSTDGSKEFLLANGYKVVDQQTKGVKGAFWEAFEMVKGDVIIPFSPDGNSIPEDIPKLIEKINEGFDIVIASRYLGAAKSQDDDVQSALANLVLTGLINLLFRAKYTDAIGMYKAFYKHHLYALGIDKYKNEHSEIMLPARGKRYGLRITEIPSPEPRRIGPQGSRAHPGVFGKYKSGLLILQTICRDALLYWPK